MTTCKCIKNYYYGGELLYEANDKLYPYSHNKFSNVYVDYDGEYCVFTTDISNNNNDYFYEYFIDVKHERKLKIQKINEVRRQSIL